MGHRYDDDDDESVWDFLIRPASMDYNGDGKIDDIDAFIEHDLMDQVFERGKYDPYNDPYYIAQKKQRKLKKNTSLTAIWKV